MARGHSHHGTKGCVRGRTRGGRPAKTRDQACISLPARHGVGRGLALGGREGEKRGPACMQTAPPPASGCSQAPG